MGRVTLLESLRGIRLVLWDETAKLLISFREARKLRHAGLADESCR
jgi:omega-6 fatty acid desaturase (delta-12 desaturase)